MELTALQPHPHQLTTRLKQLRLSGILETLDVRLRQAMEEQWSHMDFLERLLEDEAERRNHKQFSLRVRRANFQPDKTIERFDFTFNPQINRAHILELANCQFVARKEPVLIVGPTGVGKSHLAQAFGHAACRRGYDVLYLNATKMLQHLNGGRADGSYERRLQSVIRPDLLILDDFGLKPLQPSAPADFYDVISERYERGATIVTSNRALNEWASLFGDPVLASAGLDRLFHNAHVLVITGPSFRARDRAKDLSVAASSAVSATKEVSN